MQGNPIKYTSQDFDTVLNDINNDSELNDKPNWFKRLIAGAVDVLSMVINSIANLSFLRTSFTRQATQDLLTLIDYQLTQPTTSSGNCIFYLNPNVTFPITFLKEELKGMSQGNISTSSLQYEAEADFIAALNTGTLTYTSSNIFTSSYDFTCTGHKVRLTGTLPTPFQTDTDYYIIYVSTTQIKLASSVANAFNGTYITVTGSGNATFNQLSFETILYQHSTKEDVIIGTSDGVTEWQEFTLPDLNIIDTSISVTVVGDFYTRNQIPVEWESTSLYFKTIPKTSGTIAIRFGNGTFGKIPVAGSVVASYYIGGGSKSNISNYNKITTYSGGNSNIQGIANCEYMTGGSDEESTESAKIQAPLLLKARSTFVTVEDGVVLAKSQGGLELVQILRNFYGSLTCKVIAIATGGGNPSSAKQLAVQNYLIPLTILESVDVRFVDGTITSVALSTSVKILSSYTWSIVYNYILIASKLFFSETGTEIKNVYDTEGSVNAITRLNNIFSTSFATNDTQIIKLIDNLTPRQFGDEIDSTDISTYIQGNVSGIDYMTISNPTLPLVLDSDEITTHTGSTFTITQV